MLLDGNLLENAYTFPLWAIQHSISFTKEESSHGTIYGFGLNAFIWCKWANDPISILDWIGMRACVMLRV